MYEKRDVDEKLTEKGCYREKSISNICRLIIRFAVLCFASLSKMLKERSSVNEGEDEP